MRWELRRFPALLRAGEPGRVVDAPLEVCADDLRRLRARSRWERATYAVHFAALRQFLAWARNPIVDEKGVWRLPSGEPSRRRWLDRDELLRLVRIPHGRSRALVLLEGMNGLRRVEVLRLRAKDVLYDEGCLRVLGKGRNGGKWRKIPMHPSVEPELRRLTRALDGEERVFPLSRSGADLLLRRAAVAAGLAAAGRKVGHHDLRRTFGRLAHAAGMDLVQLKNLMGHASVDMTAHYVGLDTDEMRAGLRRFACALGAGEPRRADSARPRPRRGPRLGAARGSRTRVRVPPRRFGSLS